jgi:hypothetical protein
LEIFSLLIGSLIVLLIIALVITIIRYPKDIIRGFLGLIEPDIINPSTWLFLPIWLLVYGLDKLFKRNLLETSNQNSEAAYPADEYLTFDFREGRKAIFAKGGIDNLKSILLDFFEISEFNYSIEDFKIDASKKGLIECPLNISFMDFNILIQFFNQELKGRSYGLFQSPSLTYYSLQDSKTMHNIIGATLDGRKFSVFTLDELNKKVQLRLNKKIKLNSNEIEMDGVQQMLKSML